MSTGDFAPALAAIARQRMLLAYRPPPSRGPKDVWIDEHKRWSERDLLAKSYVYVWADGVLVIIGAMPEGKMELLGLVADHHQKSR